MKKITEVHDFQLNSSEKAMIEELLKVAQLWKENTCLVDWPLARLLENVEIRCLEVLRKDNNGRLTSMHELIRYA